MSRLPVHLLPGGEEESCSSSEALSNGLEEQQQEVQQQEEQEEEEGEDLDDAVDASRLERFMRERRRARSLPAYPAALLGPRAAGGKRVKFADSMGLDLTRVKLYSSMEDPEIPSKVLTRHRSSLPPQQHQDFPLHPTFRSSGVDVDRLVTRFPDPRDQDLDQLVTRFPDPRDQDLDPRDQDLDRLVTRFPDPRDQDLDRLVTRFPDPRDQDLDQLVTRFPDPRDQDLVRLVTWFPDPRDQDLDRRLGRLRVCLETVSVSQLDVRGSVRALGGRGVTEVGVRYTFNHWLSHVDAQALPVTSDPQGQRFSFTVYTPPVVDPSWAVSFAVFLRSDDGEFWDNNEGENYTLQYGNLPGDPPGGTAGVHHT